MSIRPPTRREVLHAGAFAALVSVAGCLGSTEPPGDGTPSRTPSPPTTDPGYPDARLEVTHRACGQGTNRATLERDENHIAIDGTIAGSDTCATASLGAITREGGTLTVTVTSIREPDGTTACAQCITDIDYLATIPVTGGGPDRVVVVHESLGERTTVATLER